MQRIPAPLGLACLLALVTSLGAWLGASPNYAEARDEPDFESQVLPYLRTYCVNCHSGEHPKGRLDLSPVDTLERARAAVEIWPAVYERVEYAEMPPAGHPQPNAEENEILFRWLRKEFTLGSATEEETLLSSPTLRRLNHTEYQNTVRDFLGVDFPATTEFPAEAVGHGFDNIGDALFMPDALFEKYLDAAERIAAEAIVVEDPENIPVHSFDSSILEGGRPVRNSRVLLSVGNISAQHTFPRTGIYEITIEAYGQQAGADICRMAFWLNDKEMHKVEVPATEDSPVPYSMKTRIEEGRQTISARFLNDYYQKDAEPGNRDRNLFVSRIEIKGPLDPPTIPVFQMKLRDRFARQDGRKNRREALEYLTLRAWRRPPSKPELARLEKLIPKKASWDEMFRISIEALLASPHFLFRIESDPDAETKVQPLNSYELATRLSYFLWSSMPDEELFEVAANNGLSEPAIRTAQVKRMLEHPKSRALADNFAAQWLQTRNLDVIDVDQDRFPLYDATLRNAMRQETMTFFYVVLHDELNVWRLLDADFTYVNDSLAELYGIEGVRGSQMRRVSLAGTQRRGVLTQASVLTITSNPTRTSPVKRGRWVMENLLGAPPPPPPPGADSLSTDPADTTGKTLREQLEAHRKDPNCAVCHSSLDPIGFGLENFDAIGAWRTTSGGQALDTRGDLPDGRSFQGSLELIQMLRKDPAFVKCLVEKLYVYALGRGLERADRPEIDRVLEQLDPQKPTLKQIIHGIIESEAFLNRFAADKN